MKFSLVKFTLALLLAVGTQAAYWNSLPNEHNIQQREIHVPHPRLRRVYMDKVTKPDTSVKSTDEDAKDVADKVTDIKDEVEDDSNVKDLNKEPIELTTAEVPAYDTNVKNEVNKDLEKESDVEEEQRRKRNTYEGLNKKKVNGETIDESDGKTYNPLESKPMEEVTTVNPIVESNTLSEEVDTDVPEEDEEELENTAAKRLKREMYEGMKKSQKKGYSDEELNKSKLQSTTSQSDIPVELNKKPATPLKSEPGEKISIIDVESTTSQSDTELNEKTEETTKQSTESENNKEEARRKRNTYKDMKKDEIKIVDDKELKEKPETPLKSKPLEETLDTESTTPDSGYDIATDKSEDKLIEKPNENETEDNEIEEHRRKRNAYGYVKKTEIQVDTDEKINEKPTTALNSDSLKETTTTVLDIDLTTSQSTEEEEQTA